VPEVKAQVQGKVSSYRADKGTSVPQQVTIEVKKKKWHNDDSLNILESCTDPGHLASTLVMRWVASHIT